MLERGPSERRGWSLNKDILQRTMDREEGAGQASTPSERMQCPSMVLVTMGQQGTSLLLVFRNSCDREFDESLSWLTASSLPTLWAVRELSTALNTCTPKDLLCVSSEMWTRC